MKHVLNSLTSVQPTMLSEAGSRSRRTALSALSSASEIVVKRLSMLLKDLARLKLAARALEEEGYSWSDSSYRALVSDINELEKAVSSLTGLVRLTQRDVATVSQRVDL
jgi:flagellar capping protein FliD